MQDLGRGEPERQAGVKPHSALRPGCCRSHWRVFSSGHVEGWRTSVPRGFPSSGPAFSWGFCQLMNTASSCRKC